MRLIVGLGNPGRKYSRTRHNIGFLCLEAFAAEKKLKFRYDKKFIGEIAQYKNAYLLKPQTYMNLSGNSVGKMADYYDIDPADILIIYDDLDLPTAKIRLRPQGGTGGHKGLQSVLPALGTNEIKRIRFGIGNPEAVEVTHHVLSKFLKSEGDMVIKGIDTVKTIIERFANGEDFTRLMNEYN